MIFEGGWKQLLLILLSLTPQSDSQVGALEDVTAKIIRMAPVAQCSGVFNAFRPVGNCEWVALPNWCGCARVRMQRAYAGEGERANTEHLALRDASGGAWLPLPRSHCTTLVTQVQGPGCEGAGGGVRR